MLNQPLKSDNHYRDDTYDYTNVKQLGDNIH